MYRAILLFLLLAGNARAFTLPENCRQMILGVVDDMQGSEFAIRRYEKSPGGDWVPVGEPIPARGGSAGFAWGRGLYPVPAEGPVKKEGDRKTPCGVFALGGAYGYAIGIRKHPRLPYRKVELGDLWVEDPESLVYNEFVSLGRPPDDDWERRQQMRLDDPAHALRLFIACNAPPDVEPGAGSAIFFHIWRGDGAIATAGCTSMAADELSKLLMWVNPELSPLYALLPRAVYERVKTEWKLP